MIVFVDELVDAVVALVIARRPSSLHLISKFVISLWFSFVHFVIYTVEKLVGFHIILIILL
jgi:hypothetical protein